MTKIAGWVCLALCACLLAACDDDGACEAGCSQHGAGEGGAGVAVEPGSQAGVGGGGGAGVTAGVGGVEPPPGGDGSGAATADAGGAGEDAGASDAAAIEDGGRRSEDVWSPLSVIAIVDPMEHGAVGDGVTDDLAAFQRAIDALPTSGGIVFLRESKAFLKTDLLTVTKDHVKLWAPNRTATVQQNVNGTRRKQSILCRNIGCGFFGLKLRSDGAARFDALEDNQISADHGSLVEVVGCEIEGSAATGIFLYGSSEHYIEGNYIHHTWADHIHHTDGARASWVWGNWILNGLPSKGDDGVACVTYHPNAARCGDMEWWRNTILRTDWGRGFAVIGGDDIFIHHNVAMSVAGAGIIVASESSFTTSASRDIRIEDNVVYQAGHSIGHPGILVSGLNPEAGPLEAITLRDNIVVDSPNGPYRVEGQHEDVSNEGMRSAEADLPSPLPTDADIRIADTTVLRTRDTSHVEEGGRRGLYRIHVRREPGASQSFQQRFEYVVRGASDALEEFAAARTSAGDHVSSRSDVGAARYAIILTREPIALPDALAAVDFRELREGDRTGTLSDLFRVLDSGAYE